jgi:hypothetical protein
MKLPDELEELKNRLRIELDDQSIQISRSLAIELAVMCVDDWYEEYQSAWDYEKIIESPVPEKKDAEYWSNWALQNIS